MDVYIAYCLGFLLVTIVKDVEVYKFYYKNEDEEYALKCHQRHIHETCRFY